MSFDVSTQAEIKAALLAALRNAIDGLDTSTHSDAALKAGALAHLLEGLGYKLSWISDQIFPDSASSDNVDRHAQTYNLTRRDPTYAEGDAEFSGTPTSTIPAGTVFTKADGWAYETSIAGTIGGGGTVVIACVATDAGLGGNVEAGEIFTLTSPPAGVDSTATADTDFTGGLDEETDAELVVRLLDRIRHPPAGGTANDWKQWALEVDGVTEAYVFPLRRGAGTVDVVIFTAGAGGERAAPGAALITAVTNYLEEVRPVTVWSFEVLAATEVEVDVTVDDLVVEAGYDAATVADAVEAAIEARFPVLAPGETLYLTTDLHSVIADVEGVQDYTLTAQVANVDADVTPTLVEVLVHGTITVTPA